MDRLVQAEVRSLFSVARGSCWYPAPSRGDSCPALRSSCQAPRNFRPGEDALRRRASRRATLPSESAESPACDKRECSSDLGAAPFPWPPPASDERALQRVIRAFRSRAADSDARSPLLVALDSNT